MNRRDIATRASDLRWPVLFEVKRPEPGTVQLWCSLLQCEGAKLAQFSRLLAPEEIQRAARFRTETLRQRFIVSRGVLRRMLGKCLEVAPKHVRFVAGTRGKPQLLQPCGIEFNLAHTADLMLLAVTCGLPVGVDVERVRRLNDFQALARRFFTKREADWLRDWKDGQLAWRFFDLWTRKEAILKATGEGISGGLAALELLNSDGTFKGEVPGETKACATAAWAVCQLEPALGFVGALAFPVSAGPVALQKATVPPP